SLADLNKSLEIEQYNAEALRNRGETYFMMNRYEESLADFNKSLKIEPYNAEALMSRKNIASVLRNRGETYRMMNKYEESLADLNKSLEIESNNANALRNRGETYRMMNRYEESLADLNKSLAIDPYTSELVKLVTREKILEISNKLLEIEPYNTEALRSRNHLASILRNRGETYRKINRYEESLANLNKSLEIEPNNANALRNRGKTYRNMNRYEESLADLNKSLEIEPNNADALRSRGEIYRIMNGYDELLADFNKLLEIEPNNAEALRWQRIIGGWASGNKEIDDFIKQIQIKTTKYENLIEWIPFDKLIDFQIIGQGGFGTVFSANWLDGNPIINTNNLQSRKQSCKVALKTLSTLKEFENHVQCRLNGIGLEVYGMTQDTETQKYLMVFQYADKGNLYEFLISNFKQLDWESKLTFLIDMANDLTKIHESGYIHCDFHSGNVLLNQYKNFFIKSFITDLGLSKNLKESAAKGDVYGVMPYIAPEILLGQPYTQAADIYSLGIIMTELSTGKRPFYGSPFDFRLALDICKGLRPECSERTPELLKSLVQNFQNGS
ncbi:kinase-like domain-containing protein, partial [Gigaspora rosea]